MAGRLPGADSIESFWSLLCEGRDAIRHFTPAELDPSIPAALRADPAYVPARGVLDDVDLFDAAFFGIGAREAELMDPQQRLFLEICWQCLERAGELPGGRIGVFAGMHNATYFQRHLGAHPQAVERLGEFAVMLANEKDYVASRVANRLNLRGPAISLNTACSTSLVAIAQAFDSVRAGHCEMALAGGVAINCPPNSGYLYQEGSMLSPDGRTRSFDAASQGTVFSDGAAVVLLKPLSAAIRDGNTVYAVIRSAAVNNDGGEKASFTAPSVDGQAAVVGEALRRAAIPAETVSYVEAHGTATPLGDPVEVEALRRAYEPLTGRRGFCGIGSVKSNVGHTVMAAGAASVIKTALALHHQCLPATIHFERPNPKIDFSRTPFHVIDRHTPWPRTAVPRRAGVSSFGVGGTNAHLILEEAPAIADRRGPAAAGPHWLRLSARTPAALAASADRLSRWLAEHRSLDLVDVAFTLDAGRSRFAHRLAVIADDREQAVALLADPAAARRRGRAVAHEQDASARAMVWLFPGQGAQYLGMGRERGRRDPAFARAFDDALRATGVDGLRECIWGSDPDALNDTAITQPAMFCVEYALAQSWLARGLRPSALVGHSIGEFAAAVVAGVMSLDDAARLVAARGALMQALPRGSMLSVMLPAAELEPLLPARVSLAAINAPQACVVAGPTPTVQAFDASLRQRGVATRLLRTSHAFHSPMMDGAVEPFARRAAAATLRASTLPFYSTVRGMRVDDAAPADPTYWAAHLREPVRFAPALQAALGDLPDALLVEMGPRAQLGALARQRANTGGGAPSTIAALGESPDEEVAADLLARATLWTLGDERDSTPRRADRMAREDDVPVAAPRRRVVLPTYPFERQRHWLDTGASGAGPSPGVGAAIPTPSVLAAAPARPAPSAAMAMESFVMNPPVAQLSASSPPRRERVLAELRTVFEDISGLSLADADASASFVELGLDSLMLTQVALQVKKHFSVPVTFRQLMESLRSFDELAAHLDERLPVETVPIAPTVATGAVAPAAAAMPVAMAGATGGAMPAAFAAGMPAAFQAPVAMPGGAPADAGLLQQVIAAQMQLMSQQLALLSGTAAGSVVAVAPVSQAAPAFAASVSAPACVPAPAIAPAAAPAADSSAADAPAGGKAVYDVKKAFGAIARIRKQDAELTDLQRVRLDALIRRYVERTRKSKTYTERHRPHLADPRVVNGFSPRLKEMIYQIVVERSKGAHLWDLDGNRYVDALNGFGMSLFGWQPDFVLEAVRRQLDEGYEIGPQHPLAGEVAQLLCELTGFDRAALCNTGSEAVMAAVRMARTVTGRDTVVLFNGSYHGTFDEVVVRQGRQMKGLPAAPGIMPGMFGDVRVLDYGTDESLAWIREHAHELAAVLVEPVQSRRPDFQPKEFLRALREIATAHGACLIFDEMITGFRSHLGGVQALFGIRADLATYGKVIGGGHPIGAVAGRREFMDALDGGAWRYGDDSVPTAGVTYFAGTFVRHPLALAACKASLLHLKASGHALQTQLNLHTAGLADELNAYCREVGAPLQIRHFASLWRITMLEEHPMQDLLFAMMRTRGVHILDNFPCFLTTAHTPADIALIKQAFKESVAELQAADFLPRRAEAPVVLDASRPPVPEARLGRGRDGRPAWFVPDPEHAGRFKRLNA
ncbi:MAG: aminotransferase class III-fold pyridoxal phosphate-dependent enzyme [Burkholderiaceae bacterium]